MRKSNKEERMKLDVKAQNKTFLCLKSFSMFFITFSILFSFYNNI